MVVDIRYHLASLVAVFLSLGLGILIGTSLSGGDGFLKHEEWLASLERELEQMQRRRSDVTLQIQEVQKERDLYAQFAETVSRSLYSDALTGEYAAIVLMGGDRSVLNEVHDVLHASGATVSRLAHIGPTWNDRMDRFLALLTPDESPAAKRAGVQLARAMVADGSDLFTTIDAPALWLDVTSSNRPSFVTFVIGDTEGDYISLLEETLEELTTFDIPATIIVMQDFEAWQPIAERYDLSLVSHLSSPFGRISLIHSLAHNDAALYGLADSFLPWPENLFGLSGSSGEKNR